MKALELLPLLVRVVVADAQVTQETSGLQVRVRQSLEDILQRSNAYHFGPADRLIPWVAPDPCATDPRLRSSTVSSVLTTLWEPDRHERLSKLAAIVTELVKNNKRLLLIAPESHTVDEALLAVAKALRGAGLQYRSFLCRYDRPSLQGDTGINLMDVSFDAQVSAFLGKAQSDKAGLREKLERYLELIPILRYKTEKQKDLDEVRNLEWRLLSELGDIQAKIQRLEETLAVYETLPLWQRLGMQAVGSNTATMRENCALYELQKQDYLKELELVQERINELTPEAYIDPEMRPEYEELKEQIERLGGVDQVRAVLASEENTMRLPFLQTKRVLAITAMQLVGDAIFRTLRFDAVVVEDAPHVPLPLLMIGACMARERIVLAGNPLELPAPTPTPDGICLGWPTAILPQTASPAGTRLA